MIWWFEKNRGISFVIVIVIAFLIFYISSLNFGSGGGGGYMSYIYHFTAFSYLALFLLIFLTKGKNSKSMIILAVVISILYGISDEIHQSLVPGRDSSLKDILVDSIGILITSIAYGNYCRRK